LSLRTPFSFFIFYKKGSESLSAQGAEGGTALLSLPASLSSLRLGRKGVWEGGGKEGFIIKIQ